MEHIKLIFFFLGGGGGWGGAVRYLVHLFSFLRGSGGSEPPSARRVLQGVLHAGGVGTPDESKLLLPEPADGEEALCKTRCDCLFWCQTQQEQVTFTSVPVPPQLTPFPHHTKMGEPSLAQPPHKSSSASQASAAITATTSPSVTVNFKVQLQ